MMTGDMRRQSAIVLLVFANDRSNERRFLPNLAREQRELHDIFERLLEVGAIEDLRILWNATVRDLLAMFRKGRFRGRIPILHFAGHASGSALMFENAQGTPSSTNAGALADYLGQQSGLILVFLNGCSTQGQILGLRTAGIKAVVATSRAVEDDVAAEFARQFYVELAQRPLRNAFETAKAAVRAIGCERSRELVVEEGKGREEEEENDTWILACDPAYDAWTLNPPGARSSWARHRVPWLLALSLALLVSSIAGSMFMANSEPNPAVREAPRHDSSEQKAPSMEAASNLVVEANPVHQIPYGKAFFAESLPFPTGMTVVPTRQYQIHHKILGSDGLAAPEAGQSYPIRVFLRNHGDLDALITNVRVDIVAYTALPDRYIVFWDPKGLENVTTLPVLLNEHEPVEALPPLTTFRVGGNDTELLIIDIRSGAPGMYEFKIVIAYDNGLFVETDGLQVMIPDDRDSRGVYVTGAPSRVKQQLARQLLEVTSERYLQLTSAKPLPISAADVSELADGADALRSSILGHTEP